MITISHLHNQARLTGTKTFIDTGTAVAILSIYDTARVAIDESPLGAPLVDIPLTNPCGTLGAGGLTLTQGADGLILRTGVALWARLFTRDGLVSADFTVRADADPVGNGEIAMPLTTLYAGGAARITDATLT